MSRPTKLTPDVHAAIVNAILAGNYAETAARYAGVTPATFYNWTARGREAKQGIYFEFFDAIEKAKAQAEVRDVAIIERAANDTWQAAAWMLERKFPARWGRTDRAELTGKNGGPIQHEIGAADELLTRITDIVERRKANQDHPGDDARPSD